MPRELVYAEPHVTQDGSTVIAAARVHGSRSTPVGVFVIRADSAQWVPAVDADRIALIGVATGFVAATLGCLAVLRTPPWAGWGTERRLPR
ncbi:hypothetical protein [Tsukamurella sp. 1534]|uniref:hypothetical protein n=1 Tax=Tsukamurella sp. 1534 TaxID=1151061 RepID=UPI00030058AB|nr:hypothetical protein [Tsukamurella sp. 1534]